MAGSHFWKMASRKTTFRRLGNSAWFGGVELHHCCRAMPFLDPFIGQEMDGSQLGFAILFFSQRRIEVRHQIWNSVHFRSFLWWKLNFRRRRCWRLCLTLVFSNHIFARNIIWLGWFLGLWVDAWRIVSVVRYVLSYRGWWFNPHSLSS